MNDQLFVRSSCNKLDLFYISLSLFLVFTLLFNFRRLTNCQIRFHSRFLPRMAKVPLSRLECNDIALSEDSAPIYGGILPMKEFSLKSKIFKLLKFAISTKRIDDR